ncbi:putative transporter subunit: permease component of ABC superfamily transporter [Methylocella tundrae]|uniref:Putative transporter subunit: permease component of ABC superfamily transporter n=1 Tax=Methylocella tundrae TaxID=227605 RepID=A0A8B6MBH0_METTU|nr:ABC transporter permease [Methylocella tundrae]VTZ26752.1 putative transporter subunit: permease component of ABC superfamily transporter [Methylocella tundrae]VTZ52252.1 putative transporter subunit: permease component of ABC superfamily transporter [Methylocella tundrae]
MRVSIMAAVRVVARQPAFWLALLLVGAIGSMRWSAPLFAALFPGDPRPLYSRASFFELTLAHCELAAISSLLAAVVGIGLAVFATRDCGREFAAMISAIAAVGQTFPPVAVLALAVPILGYGAAPALAALSLYAILPILDGALTGLHNVPAAARQAAEGMGFAPLGLLWWIELPLALPFILAGLRNAVIINIGTATIGSSVGALSLGSPILEGLSASNPAYVIQGALIVALLAVAVDRGFQSLEMALCAPRG